MQSVGPALRQAAGGFFHRSQVWIRDLILSLDTSNLSIDSDACHPDELQALRACICHPQVAFKRDVAAVASGRAGWTDAGRIRIEGCHFQQPSRCRARDSRRTEGPPGYTRTPVVRGMPHEKAVIEVCPIATGFLDAHNRGGW
jgi:hypothetical protein